MSQSGIDLSAANQTAMDLRMQINTEVIRLLAQAETAFTSKERDTELILYLLEMLFLATTAQSVEF